MKTLAVAAAAAILLAPTASFAQKSGSRPDSTLTPNYGSVDLEAGFEPDPWTKAVMAGGSASASAVIDGCPGQVSAAPDLHLNYEAGDFSLTFRARAAEDTTLLINGPDGQWYCDDDSGGGFDPLVRIGEPQSGRYDIWVGTFSDDLTSSTLEISELGGASAQEGAGPDVSLEPHYGTVNLTAGFTPDPWMRTITAGGSVPASAAREGCEGRVSAAPDIQIFYERRDNVDSDLTFSATSDSDTTLLVNTPNGRFYCDDDSGGELNPKLTITNPQSGRYDIWVGSYGDEMVESVLRVTELD